MHVVRLLIVCTGNICRSALAERLGQAFLRQILDDVPIILGSAGTAAVVGAPMHPRTSLVLTGLGGSAEGFVARQLVPGLVSDAHLVLTATRDHRRLVLRDSPRALARTFTLREAASLLPSIAARPGDEPGIVVAGDMAAVGRAFVRQLHAARAHHTSTDDDDIADPVAGTLEFHQEIGETVAGALLPLLERLAGWTRVAVGRRGSAAGGGAGETDPLR